MSEASYSLRLSSVRSCSNCFNPHIALLFVLTIVALGDKKPPPSVVYLENNDIYVVF